MYGPDWANQPQRNVDCIIENIQNSALIGNQPDLRGFVGTTRTGNIVGGFFAIQYEDDFEFYDKAKRLEVRTESPFERLLFVLFADTGKLLLQTRRFTNHPLNMETARRLLLEALNRVLAPCNVGFIISISSPRQGVTDEQFIQEFQRSDRVLELVVANPEADRIPEDIEYYNPQRERNEIIRQSHRHDYPEFQRVDLEAAANGDIKATHIGRDLVRAGKPLLLRYIQNGLERILRREFPTKFVFNMREETQELSQEQLGDVLDILSRERALNLDAPTARPEDPQLNMFDARQEEHDDLD